MKKAQKGLTPTQDLHQESVLGVTNQDINQMNVLKGRQFTWLNMVKRKMMLRYAAQMERILSTKTTMMTLH